MNKISIAGENYSEIARHKLNLYPTSSWPIFKDYMETRSSEWYEYKELIAEQMSTTYLKKYNNLLTSGRCSNKVPKYVHILALVGVYQNLADDSKKSYKKYNRDPNKGDPAFIRDLPPWVLEETMYVVGS